MLSACSGDFETVSKVPQDRKQSSQITQQPSQSPSKQTSATVIDKPAILRKESKQGGCEILVRYSALGERALLWPDETCDKLTISVSSIQALKSINQLEGVAADAINDMDRYNENGFILVESEFTMSAFILNAAGRVYEVPLAD